MKRICIIALICGIILCTSCTTTPEPAIQHTVIPDTAEQTSSPVTNDTTSAIKAVTISPGIEIFSSYLIDLDRTDVSSIGKAVEKLENIYEGHIIRDEDMTSLIFYINSMQLDAISMFPDVITYPRSRIECTDWTLKGMTVFYDNYLFANQSQGTLYFEPDYIRLGTLFYDMISPAYTAFYEMQFDLSFFGIRKVVSDNILAESEAKVNHAIDVYTNFAEQHTELANVHGINEIISDLESYINGINGDAQQ